MPFITADELNTHLYGELITEITRGDTTLPQVAIDAGVSEVKSYLSEYDVDKIFSATGADRHPLILLFAKDISVWHLIALSNPNIDLDFRQKRYDAAISWLKAVERREMTPDLPTPAPPVDDQGNPVIQEGRFAWGGEPKRNSHY